MQEKRETPQPVATELVTPLSPESQQIISNFLDSAVSDRNTAFPKETRTKENLDYIDRRDHDFLLLNASHTIKEVLEYCDLDKSFIVLAKEGDKEVGFGIVGIKTEGESLVLDQSFIGVKYDQKRKSIGTLITMEIIRKLQEYGFSEGKVQVWEGSRKMLESMGLKLEQIDPKNPKVFNVVGFRE